MIDKGIILMGIGTLMMIPNVAGLRIFGIVFILIAVFGEVS